MASDPELLEEFVAEANEHLATVEDDVLALERDGAEVDLDTVNDLFRALHTVKGGAGLLELKPINTLAHALEHIVGRVREGQLVTTGPVAEALLKGIDKLKAMLEDPEGDDVEFGEELSALEAIAQNQLADEPQETPEPVPDRDPELVEDFVAEADEHLGTVEDDVLALERGGEETDVDVVNHLFRALHTVKGGAGLLDFPRVNKLAHALESIVGRIRDGDLPPGGQVSEVLLQGIDKLKALFSDLTDSSLSIEPELAAAHAMLEATPDAGGASAEAPKPDSSPDQDQPLAEDELPQVDEDGHGDERDADDEQDAPRAAPAVDQAGAPKETGDQSVRISLSLLDRLMNLASELVLVRNQNVQAMATRDLEQLSTISQRLNVVTSELQASVMQTRMRPVGSTFTRYKRIVRDLAKKLDKKIQLEIVGSEVELDKNIIEAITDPLTHLVRNAVDHGIESPQERSKRGKDPVGHLRLSAYHQAGQINIQIRDDGKGMDPEKLKAAAARKGILTEEQVKTLRPKEAFNLIFEPGFSTAAKVSSLSGRGVGMDVVKACLQRLGGTIDVTSAIGKGTTITIKLPLTLAIIPALVVSVSDCHFAVPQINIDEVVWLYGPELNDAIKQVDKQEVYWLRGKLLPVLRLGEVLGVTDKEDAESPPRAPDEIQSSYIVVLRLGSEQFGLLVDKIVDTEEIVVKALHDQLKDCGTFAGTTVLGDGRIAMILDIAAVADLGRLHYTKMESTAPVVRSSSRDDRQTVLLFDLGSHERFAIPLCLIARVEELPRKDIQTARGREYLNFRGALIPLVRLDRIISSVSSNYRDDIIYVIIPDCQRPFGILAANILDTVAVESQLDSKTIRQDGVVGSQLIDGRLTLFLDAFSAIEAVEPDWFETRADQEPRHVLLVDDSAFYRAMITFFLRGSGVEVTAVENGSEGLEALAEGQYDGVISDLDMPVMDGFEFARRVRTNPDSRDLPLLAVSAIEGEVAEVALDAGFDEYTSKADRRGMLDAVMRLCAVNRKSGSRSGTNCE